MIPAIQKPRAKPMPEFIKEVEEFISVQKLINSELKEKIERFKLVTEVTEAHLEKLENCIQRIGIRVGEDT